MRDWGGGSDKVDKYFNSILALFFAHFVVLSLYLAITMTTFQTRFNKRRKTNNINFDKSGLVQGKGGGEVSKGG